ncbi:hypothetical protein ACIQGZ_04165 [Streptomyces sp. NPDC092296]|uniref:hypothetical protein n=1 Tax=Streptomyces sp. NPDC092296 TaxID=3366012 RepID=UPI0038127721
MRTTPMPPPPAAPTDDPLLAGKAAALKLAAALGDRGIVLPHLQGAFPVRGLPLVELGTCTAETALALAAAIRGEA